MTVVRSTQKRLGQAVKISGRLHYVCHSIFIFHMRKSSYFNCRFSKGDNAGFLSIETEIEGSGRGHGKGAAEPRPTTRARGGGANRVPFQRMKGHVILLGGGELALETV